MAKDITFPPNILALLRNSQVIEQKPHMRFSEQSFAYLPFTQFVLQNSPDAFAFRTDSAEFMLEVYAPSLLESLFGVLSAVSFELSEQGHYVLYQLPLHASQMQKSETLCANINSQHTHECTTQTHITYAFAQEVLASVLFPNTKPHLAVVDSMQFSESAEIEVLGETLPRVLDAFLKAYFDILAARPAICVGTNSAVVFRTQNGFGIYMNLIHIPHEALVKSPQLQALTLQGATGESQIHAKQSSCLDVSVASVSHKSFTAPSSFSSAQQCFSRMQSKYVGMVIEQLVTTALKPLKSGLILSNSNVGMTLHKSSQNWYRLALPLRLTA